MPKDTLPQYIWVLERLMARHSMTFTDFKRAYENSPMCEPGKSLSERNFYNWRQKLLDLFDVEITYHDNVYALKNPDQVYGNQSLMWLVQSMTVNQMLSESKHLRNRILLEDVPSGKDYLGPLIEAMKDNLTVRMHYHRFGGTSYEFVVEPLCVKVNNRRWYVLCRIPGAQPNLLDYPEYASVGCLKVYALDRIDGLELTDQHFAFPEDFDPQEFFSEHFGVCIAYHVPKERVLLRVEKEHVDFIESLPLHRSQKLVEENEEFSVYELELHPTIDFFRALLSLGIDVEVLEPESLRSSMRQEFTTLARIYGTVED